MAHELSPTLLNMLRSIAVPSAETRRQIETQLSLYRPPARIGNRGLQAFKERVALPEFGIEDLAQRAGAGAGAREQLENGGYISNIGSFNVMLGGAGAEPESFYEITAKGRAALAGKSTNTTVFVEHAHLNLSHQETNVHNSVESTQAAIVQGAAEPAGYSTSHEQNGGNGGKRTRIPTEGRMWLRKWNDKEPLPKVAAHLANLFGRDTRTVRDWSTTWIDGIQEDDARVKLVSKAKFLMWVTANEKFIAKIIRTNSARSS